MALALIVVGALVLVAGTASISLSAAAIVGGVLLIVAGVDLARRGPTA